jgi:AcrR family transcriptional regulator
VPRRERDATRTRRAILDAAARTVAAQGAGASLDAIARTAGVSKGSLLHHFGSRDALLLALAEDLAEQFHAEVNAALDPADLAPGRVVRAYVNVTFDTLAGVSTAPEWILVGAALAAVPGVSDLMQRDKRRWDEALAADGLHPQRILVVTRASDGAALAGAFEGGYDREILRRTRELLLALTRVNAPLADV